MGIKGKERKRKRNPVGVSKEENEIMKGGREKKAQSLTEPKGSLFSQTAAALAAIVKAVALPMLLRH